MEQDDLAQFRYFEVKRNNEPEWGVQGWLNCYICNPLGEEIKLYEVTLDNQPNLLELMEDAAAHFAAVHRETNDD